MLDFFSFFCQTKILAALYALLECNKNINTQYQICTKYPKPFQQSLYSHSEMHQWECSYMGSEVNCECVVECKENLPRDSVRVFYSDQWESASGPYTNILHIYHRPSYTFTAFPSPYSMLSYNAPYSMPSFSSVYFCTGDRLKQHRNSL